MSDQIRRMDQDRRVREICKIGQGNACCRYLTCGADGWSCGKLDASIKTLLDRRVATNSIVAQGDNCPGVPFLADIPFMGSKQ